MKFKYDKPFAGKPFKVSVDGYSGTGHLSIYVDGKLKKTKDCPDPPCHEQIILRVEQVNKRLKIVFADDDSTERLDLEIEGDFKPA